MCSQRICKELLLTYAFFYPLSSTAPCVLDASLSRAGKWGRLTRAVFYLVIVFASFLTILHFIGWLDDFNSFLKTLTGLELDAR